MDDDYLEAVLDVVARIPPGRAMTYGTVAEVVVDALVAAGGRPRGGPRQVGNVLAHAGRGVPWWRVVNASGRSSPRLAGTSLAHWLTEGTPLAVDREHVDLRRAIWFPDDEGRDTARGTARSAHSTSGRPAVPGWLGSVTQQVTQAR